LFFANLIKYRKKGAEKMKQVLKKIWDWLKKEADQIGLAYTWSEVGFWIDREEFIKQFGKGKSSPKKREEKGEEE